MKEYCVDQGNKCCTGMHWNITIGTSAPIRDKEKYKDTKKNERRKQKYKWNKKPEIVWKSQAIRVSSVGLILYSGM